MTAKPASLIQKLEDVRQGIRNGGARNAVGECIAIIQAHFASPEVVERAAKAIQQRYWTGDLEISISDSKNVCEQFGKAALKAAAGDL
jgi:hypothetical protein